MNFETKKAAMNQDIFKIGLSIKNTSLYLLCCSMQDTGQTISVDTLSSIWNGTDKELSDGLSCLEKLNIISRKNINNKDGFIYKLLDLKFWRSTL